MTEAQVFLDANAIVYALDETSQQHFETVGLIQHLLSKDTTLCTSHHVIEEVLHIIRKISGGNAEEAVREIGKIPGLVLIEPDATIEFAHRYARLSDQLHMGVNDALLLQLMLDAGIGRLFSYDKQFIDRAEQVHIKRVV